MPEVEREYPQLNESRGLPALLSFKAWGLGSSRRITSRTSSERPAQVMSIGREFMSTDDHTVLLSGEDWQVAHALTRYLDTLGKSVRISFGDQDVVAMAHRLSPDLVILGRQFASDRAFKIGEELRQSPITQHLPIMMLVAHDHGKNIVRAVESGANDAMENPFSNLELAGRVNALLRRFSSHLQHLSYCGLEMDRISQRVRFNGRIIPLRPQQYQLVWYFLMNPERPISRSELIRVLKWTADTVSEKSIDQAVRRLRLALGDAQFLIRTERNCGYALECSEAPKAASNCR